MLLLFNLLTIAAAFSLFQPEQFMGPMEIIAHNGYPAEAHEVTTEDGYILTMHRIPHGINGKQGGRPVLLLSGLACTSFEFLSQVPSKALSYSLADAGYDVWLGNNRGTIYSMDHSSFSTLESRFWNFSWDEMAQFDLPAMVDYILSNTNESDLYFVGFSQGPLTLVASTTMRSDILSKVKHHFALAPGMSIAHLSSPLFKLANMIPGIAQSVLSFVPSQVLALPYLFPFCGRTILLNMCKFLIGEVVGPSDQLEEARSTSSFTFLLQSRLSVFTAHYPGGTSNKNLRHWLQMMKETSHFDYGEAGNRAAYGTPFPRQYNFSSYRIPTSLYFSPGDKLVNTENMKINLVLLPPSSIVRSRNLTGFSHLDFVWGNRAKNEIYDEIIGDINKMEGKK